MIDEKKLIEDLLHNDGITFTVDLHDFTPEGVGSFLREYTDKLKEGVVNLIDLQPRVSAGGWIRTADEQPGMYVSVLMYVPGDHPLPVVHEGYITGEGIWMSLYGEAYTFWDVPFWMPMPEPPKDGGGA